MQLKIRTKSNIEIYLPDEFTALSSCPHCKSAKPSLKRRYAIDRGEHSFAFEITVHWAVYICSVCAFPISIVHNQRVERVNSEYVHEYLCYPINWAPSDAIPETPRKYLEQASATISSADASVVMSGSAIDAMLKEKGLTEGSLYARIDKALAGGYLTRQMADWAHLVRLNSNNPRHADTEKPHVGVADAKLSLEFAKALAEVLFVLPSRMPSASKNRE